VSECVSGGVRGEVRGGAGGLTRSAAIMLCYI
jgi:hypothetical protein